VYLSRNPCLGDDDNKRGILLLRRLCENVVLPIDFVVLNSNKLIWSVVVPRVFLKDVKYLSRGVVVVQLN
jgi:hypothetical protein